MSSTVGLQVEFQAKTDSVTAAFNNVKTQGDQVIAKNAEISNSFSSLSQNAASGISSISSAFVGLGVVAGLGVLIDQVKNLAQAGASLYDTSANLRISVANFQQLSLAATESGASADTLQIALFKMNDTIGKAQQGNVQAIKSFAQLGTTAKDFAGLDTYQSFLKLVGLISQVGDGTLKDADSMAFFGRSAKESGALFSQSFIDSAKSLDQLNYGITQLQATDLKDLTNQFNKFYEAAKIGAMSVVADYQIGIEGIGNLLIDVATTAAGILKKAVDEYVLGIQGVGGTGSTAAGVSNFFAGLNNALGGALHVLSDQGLAETDTFLAKISNKLGLSNFASTLGGAIGLGGSSGIGAGGDTASIIPTTPKTNAYKSSIPSIQPLLDAANAQSALTKEITKSRTEFEKMNTALEGSALKGAGQIATQYLDYATSKYKAGSQDPMSDNAQSNTIGSDPYDTSVNQKFADSLRDSFQKAQDSITQTTIKLLQQDAVKYPDITPLLEQIQQEQDPGAQLQEINVTKDLLETLKKAEVGQKAAQVDLNLSISVADGFIVSSTGKGDINKLVTNAVNTAINNASRSSGTRGVQ